MVERLEEMEQGFEDAGNEVLMEVKFLEGDEGDRFTCIVQRILLAPQEETHSQINVLFRTSAQLSKKYVK